MGTVHVDCSGLKYPLPVLRIAIYVPDMKPGDIMEVNADCDLSLLVAALSGKAQVGVEEAREAIRERI